MIIRCYFFPNYEKLFTMRLSVMLIKLVHLLCDIKCVWFLMLCCYDNLIVNTVPVGLVHFLSKHFSET